MQEDANIDTVEEDEDSPLFDTLLGGVPRVAYVEDVLVVALSLREADVDRTVFAAAWKACLSVADSRGSDAQARWFRNALSVLTTVAGAVTGTLAMGPDEEGGEDEPGNGPAQAEGASDDDTDDDTDEEEAPAAGDAVDVDHGTAAPAPAAPAPTALARGALTFAERQRQREERVRQREEAWARESEARERAYEAKRRAEKAATERAWRRAKAASAALASSVGTEVGRALLREHLTSLLGLLSLVDEWGDERLPALTASCALGVLRAAGGDERGLRGLVPLLNHTMRLGERSRDAVDAGWERLNQQLATSHEHLDRCLAEMRGQPAGHAAAAGTTEAAIDEPQ